MGATSSFQAGNYAPVLSVPTGTDGPDELLRINWGNPIRSRGTVTIHMPQAGTARLDLYSLSGSRVRTLGAGMFAPGSVSITFDAGHERPGVYFLRLLAEGRSVSRRVVLLH